MSFNEELESRDITPYKDIMKGKKIFTMELGELKQLLSALRTFRNKLSLIQGEISESDRTNKINQEKVLFTNRFHVKKRMRK